LPHAAARRRRFDCDDTIVGRGLTKKGSDTAERQRCMCVRRSHVAGDVHVRDTRHIAHLQVRLPGNRGGQVVQRMLIDAELRP